MTLRFALAVFFACVGAGMLVSLLPSCVTDAPAPGAGPGPKLSKEEENKLNEYKAEVELGRNMAGRLLQFYGTLGDEAIISYVNQVGNYVASRGDYPDRRYMFAVLDNESVNAFACPGGYILVTMGSLRLAKNEAELAMILGHEVAHVGKQHMFNTLKTMGEKEREKAAEAVEAKGNEKASFEVAVRKRPSTENSETGTMIARYLSGSAGASLGLLQAAKAGMNVMLEKGLDKALEFEADHEGVKYAINAGYAPKALINFLARLEKQKKESAKKVDTSILEKTHPSIKDRMRKIVALLKDMSARDIVGAQGKARFDGVMHQLPAVKKA